MEFLRISMNRISDNLKLLEKAGLQITNYSLVSSLSEAVKQAEKIDYPVVLKINSDIHKTEVGGVITNIHDKNDLERSWKQMLENLEKHKIKTKDLLIQKQIFGVELILGLKKDIVFGQVIMLGSGGILVEIEKDVSFRVCPITEKDAGDMINEIKSKKLLEGARGQEPANIEKLKQTIVKLSKISAKELDINPLIVNENGSFVADVRIIKD